MMTILVMVMAVAVAVEMAVEMAMAMVRARQHKGRCRQARPPPARGPLRHAGALVIPSCRSVAVTSHFNLLHLMIYQRITGQRIVDHTAAVMLLVTAAAVVVVVVVVVVAMCTLDA